MYLRHETQQTVVVGVLVAKPSGNKYPSIPVFGAQLSWYYWKYIVKANGSVINIGNRIWTNVPNCAGLYRLTLTEQDTNEKGVLTLYIHDEVSLGRPIFIQYEVIDKNIYDSRFGSIKQEITKSESF